MVRYITEEGFKDEMSCELEISEKRIKKAMEKYISVMRTEEIQNTTYILQNLRNSFEMLNPKPEKEEESVNV